jgi:hypothetical protein
VEAVLMSYVDPDYKTKKEFKAAVLAGVKHRTYNPSGMFTTHQNGPDVIEGPHFPKPHRWYAQVEVKDGVVTKVK